MKQSIKNLPSEKLQKEFENNPLKILETIRNEKDSENAKADIPKIGKNVNIVKKNQLKDFKYMTSPNKDRKKLEESKNYMNASFDYIKMKNINQKDADLNNSVVNNINNLSTSNNFNVNNTLINYSPNIKINKNSNIIVNHLNIFFNFDGQNESTNKNKSSLYVNKNVNENVNNHSNENENNLCNNNNSNLINSDCKNENILCNNTNNDNCKNEKILCNDNIKTNNNKDQINSTKSKKKDKSKNKNNENFEKKLSLIEDVNKLLIDLRSYKGSIVSQAFIDNLEDQNDLALFFKNILPYICQIMCLEYGNYFFQKLIKKLNFVQRFSIYQIIEPEFLVIATNKWGTHSIQSLMDTIQTQVELLALNKLISKNMLLLFIDDNAYHIMMKMILDFPEDKRNDVNIYLVMNIEKIIINCNGAFCVNKFIINNKNLNLRKLLVENLKNNLKKLIFNKYSCINLLLLLQTFGVEWGNFIFNEIQNNFVVLLENPVSNVFISKVLAFLKNSQNIYVLKILIWSLFKNIVLMNYLLSNKSHRKLLNQLIEYSDNEQKNYLFILIKQCNW